jgi:Cyclin, N-terminal domain
MSSPSLLIQSGLERERSPNYDTRNYASPYNEEKSLGWRRRLAAWIFSLVDNFNADRSVAVIALNYMDRYMAFSTEDTVDLDLDTDQKKRDCQLVAITSIYVAFKIHASEFLTMAFIVEVGRGLFQASEIQAMELKLMAVLDYKLDPPIPFYFVFHWKHVLELKENTSLTGDFLGDLLNAARYITEVSACEGMGFAVLPSEMGLAALLAALDVLADDSEVNHRALFETTMRGWRHYLLTECGIPVHPSIVEELYKLVHPSIVEELYKLGRPPDAALNAEAMFDSLLQATNAAQPTGGSAFDSCHNHDSNHDRPPENPTDDIGIGLLADPVDFQKKHKEGDLQNDDGHHHKQDQLKEPEPDNHEHIVLLVNAVEDKVPHPDLVVKKQPVTTNRVLLLVLVVAVVGFLTSQKTGFVLRLGSLFHRDGAQQFMN